MNCIKKKYNTKYWLYWLINKYIEFVSCNNCKQISFKCKIVMIHVIIYINAKLWSNFQCIQSPKMSLNFLLKFFKFF